MAWDAEGEAWTVAIEPGWCESPTGDPSPSVETIARLAPASVEALASDDRAAVITALLVESPRLTIPQKLWRAEGTDAVRLPGAESIPLPAVVAAAGVLDATALIETDRGLVQQIEGLVVDRAQARLARACEVYLEHGRETAALMPVEEGGVLRFTVTFRPAPVAAPRIRLRREMIDEEATPLRWMGDDSGIVSDEGIDRRHLATLWLISPRGEAAGSLPDGRWTPYIEPWAKRNLAYEVTGPAVRTVDPLVLNVPGRDLGLGAGRSIIDLFAGDLQSQADALDARLADTRTTGSFITF